MWFHYEDAYMFIPFVMVHISVLCTTITVQFFIPCISNLKLNDGLLTLQSGLLRTLKGRTLENMIGKGENTERIFVFYQNRVQFLSVIPHGVPLPHSNAITILSQVREM